MNFTRAPIQNVAAGKESQRRFIVMMVNLIFVLVLLEGVLRKWVLSGIEQPLVFIRDPFMIAVIIAYLGYRGGRLSALSFWYVLAAIALAMLAIIQMSAGIGSLTTLIGLRFYLLFVPLLFIIPETFKRKDVAMLIRLCLWACIPVGILVVIQFYSPVASPINKGLSDDIAGRFTVVAGVVRPYGPFTFVQAQNVFATFALACMLLALMRPQLVGAPRLLILFAGVSILAMGALAGGRTFFVAAIILVGFAMAGSLLSGMKTRRFGGTAAILAVVIMFGLFFVVVFPEAYATMSERQAAAQASEGSIFNRLWTIVSEVFGQLDMADVRGFGIGAGSNAGSFLTTGQRVFLLAESEWPRMILELGPIMGTAFVVLRILVVILIVYRALRAARHGDSSAMIIAGFCATPLLIGQITGSNGMVTLPWLAGGLALVLTQMSPSVTAATNALRRQPLRPALFARR